MFKSSLNSSADNSTLKCCEFYLKNNWCGYGSRCKFAHSIPNNYFSKNNELNNRTLIEPGTLVSTDQQQPADGQHTYLVQGLELSPEKAVPLPQGISNSENVRGNRHFKRVYSSSKTSASKPPSQACRYYSKDSRCPFGDKCKYLHEAPEAKIPQTRPKNDNSIRYERNVRKTDKAFNWRERKVEDPQSSRSNKNVKTCRYYLKGSCRNDDKCKFFHPKDANVVKVATTEEASLKVDDSEANDTKPERIFCQKPVYHLNELNETFIKELRELEISQMKKRIINENMVEVEDKYYRITVIPTDPDWPYDVKQVIIRINYPQDYPKQVFNLELDCEDNEELPLTLTKCMQESIFNWLKARQEMNVEEGIVELMFRPFLNWFDRNLEMLFTSGLKQTKKHVDAKAAGIEFVPYNQLPGFDSNPTLATAAKETNEEYNQLNNSSVPDINTLDERDRFNENDCVPINDIHLLQISKKGTEVKLINLQLGENVGALVCQNLQVTIQCARCKAHHDIFAAPRRKNLVPCTKCHQNQIVTFRPAMIHQHADILGYLDLEGCQAFDLPIVDSTFSVTCLHCDKQKSSNGIHYSQMWNNWCFGCNVKLDLLVGSFKFQILRPGMTSGNDPVNVINLEKLNKKVKDPAIQEGKSLPNNGTCKHYKKSYRWFRFPCCGKAYPCDLCHNEKELEHEMKLANRVICGFCGKEQPFTNKPCSICSSNMTQNIKGHWEGGKGCRDKVKMSRDDRQKYTGLNKTIAKTVKDKKPAIKN